MAKKPKLTDADYPMGHLYATLANEAEASDIEKHRKIAAAIDSVNDQERIYVLEKGLREIAVQIKSLLEASGK